MQDQWILKASRRGKKKKHRKLRTVSDGWILDFPEENKGFDILSKSDFQSRVLYPAPLSKNQARRMAISAQALKKLLPYPLPFLKSYWKMNSAKRKDSWKMREKRGSRKRVSDMRRSQRKSPTWWASRLKVRTVFQGEIDWLLNIHESSKRIFT